MAGSASQGQVGVAGDNPLLGVDSCHPGCLPWSVPFGCTISGRCFCDPCSHCYWHPVCTLDHKLLTQPHSTHPVGAGGCLKGPALPGHHLSLRSGRDGEGPVTHLTTSPQPTICWHIPS